MQLLGAQHIARQGIEQRLQQCAAGTHPAGHGRTIDLDAISGINLALAIERKVIAVLGYQHMGQKTGTGQTPFDRS